MKHCLKCSKDKYHILRFLDEFIIWKDCVLTIYQSEEMFVCSCVYPKAGNHQQWQLIREKLGENIGPNSFVRYAKQKYFFINLTITGFNNSEVTVYNGKQQDILQQITSFYAADREVDQPKNNFQ